MYSLMLMRGICKLHHIYPRPSHRRLTGVDSEKRERFKQREKGEGGKGRISKEKILLDY